MANQVTLPEGWLMKSLGELVEAKYGKGLRQDRRTGGHVPVYGSNGQVGRHGVALSKAPAIIVGRKGSAGAVHFSNEPCWPIDTTYFIDRFPQNLEPRYLFRSLSFQNLPDLDRSTAVPGLNRDDLYAIQLPLPPLPEQRRIVEKIERLLEQSRTAREALDRIPPLLKRFRQSVLAKAFRGELTERDPSDEAASVLLERIREERRRKWEEVLRARGKDSRKTKFVEPEPPDTSGLPELPQGWVWTAMGDGIATMKNGIYKPPSFYGEGTPCLRMYNILSGRIVMKDIKLMRLEPSEVDEYGLLPGDVLVNRVNSRELVGKCAVIPGGLGDLVYESKNIRLRVREAVALPEYVMYAINSRIVRDVVELRAKQTVGMATINQTDIQSWPLPLAPLSEQRRIIAKLEATFGQAETIEQTVAQSLRRAEQVDQAMLARAFRGEL
jgi:type I restriction enzyme S subunit